MNGEFVDLGIPGIVQAQAVGSGGVATVYRAFQSQLNRTVAVKVIQGVSDPATTRRFEREASALGSLSEHPGIVTLYSTGTTSSGQPYFIMQYCPNGSLQDYLAANGPLAAPQACQAISQIAASLADAHDQGVLHRDLKPANILIDAAGNYLVADFGIAAITGSTAGISSSLSFTAGYVPPEILQGEPATAAGDVYSLGATLYALVRGKMPFASAEQDEQNVLALITRLNTQTVEDTRPHGVPDATATLIERCMAKDPAQRPQMRELAALAATAATPGPGSDLLEGPQPGALPPMPANIEAAPLEVPVATSPASQPAQSVARVQPASTAAASQSTRNQSATSPGREPKALAIIAMLAVLFVGLGSFFVAQLLTGGDETSALATSATPPPPPLPDANEEPAATQPGEVEDAPGSSVQADDGDTDGTRAPASRLPTTAGLGGELELMQWQLVETLNPYLTGNTTDLMAASLVLEPLIRIAPDGTLVPALAAELPERSNPESASVTEMTWRLRRDVVWSDGTPFTAADVVFTWDYCSEIGTGCGRSDSDQVIDVEAVDDFTVIVRLLDTTSFPYGPFVGFRTPIVQEAQFSNCVGDASNVCDDRSLLPIGTGPYVVSSELSADLVYDLNSSYRGVGDGQPFFGTVVLRQGSDPESAGRSVVEFGDADYAWNLPVVPALLEELSTFENGRVVTAFGSNVEHISLNQTNNRAEGELISVFADGTNPHPYLANNAVLAEALSLAINRDELTIAAYWSAAAPTCDMWNVGRDDGSRNEDCLVPDVARANALLDGLGYVDTDENGVREFPDGAPMEFELSTSTNAPRQVVQELIAGYWAEIGVAVDMRQEEPLEFFGDADTSIWRFPTDMVMFTNGAGAPDPAEYLSFWGSDAIPTPENSWSGFNIPRLSNVEYDTLLGTLRELDFNDPQRAAVVARLDDILSSESGAVIPLVLRGNISAFATDMVNTGSLNSWDSEYWNIQEWTREG